jgi:porphobilinogen deaminase
MITNSVRTFQIATRGSALALAQSNFVLKQCREAFPDQRFELKIIRTTGDKLQTASMAQQDASLPKGLFTKELEVALLEHQADFAVHSLKDLPTDLPAGLKLAAVGKREDVRDVLIYRNADSSTRIAGKAGSPPETGPGRGYGAGTSLKNFPDGAVLATSSTRRKAQVLLQNPKLTVVEIRGNVATRLQKVAERPELDATLLALAGLTRLNYRLGNDGRLQGESVPDGLLVTILDTDVMLPCVGQGAVGIEARDDDEQVATICERLNHYQTLQCVTAERMFLAGMGGGCQSPVAAYAQLADGQLHMRAISFANGPVRRAEASRPANEARELGQHLAALLKG